MTFMASLAFFVIPELLSAKRGIQFSMMEKKSDEIDKRLAIEKGMTVEAMLAMEHRECAKRHESDKPDFRHPDYFRLICDGKIARPGSYVTDGEAWMEYASRYGIKVFAGVIVALSLCILSAVLLVYTIPFIIKQFFIWITAPEK